MAELGDQLNAILSDPGSMAQIMQLAQQLSGGQAQTEQPTPPPPAAPALDPQLLTQLAPLLQEYQRGNSQTMQLLMALRPFLRPEKQEKVERAAQLSRLIHVGKRFLLNGGPGRV